MKDYEKDTTNEALQEQLKEIFGDRTPVEARDLMDNFHRLMSYYQCAMMEIETKFRVLNEEFSLLHDRNPINNIHTRLKSGFSIRDKLARRNLPFTMESIENDLDDIAGIRVVCSFINDVYYLEEALLKQDDITLIRRKDYIAEPKDNGYRSLHLIIAIPIFLSNQKREMKVEVQLRTISMDSWASLEHQLRYKKSVSDPKKVEQALQNCARLSRELDTTMDQLREIVITGDYMQS